MKTVVTKEAAERAAQEVRRVLQERPEVVLALSARGDCFSLYDRLAGDCEAGKISFSQARFFAVEEFEGLPEHSAESCRARLSAFLKRTDADKDACVFLSAVTMEDYDALLADAGGLDLAILGLGENAAIGFNEPATPYASRTHRQKLAPATKRELALRFGGEENVPTHALTMGIKTLVEAKEILLFACGETRAKAVFNMLYGRNDTVIPAAFLQLPTEVTVILDEDAAAKL